MAERLDRMISGRSYGKAEILRRLEAAERERATEHAARWINRLGLRALGHGLTA